MGRVSLVAGMLLLVAPAALADDIEWMYVWVGGDVYRQGWVDVWPSSVSLTGPEYRSTLVASGWDAFVDVEPAADGALFALAQDGELWWYQLNGTNDDFVWSGPVPMGGGWDQYQYVFGCGDGVVYGVDGFGDLYWNRYEIGGDHGIGTLVSSWDGPEFVGVGWGRDLVKDAVCTGSGQIYVQWPDDTVTYYEHYGWEDGSWWWSDPTDWTLPQPTGYLVPLPGHRLYSAAANTIPATDGAFYRRIVRIQHTPGWSWWGVPMVADVWQSQLIVLFRSEVTKLLVSR